VGSVSNDLDFVLGKAHGCVDDLFEFFDWFNR
jgi:hypothetical protein